MVTDFWCKSAKIGTPIFILCTCIPQRTGWLQHGCTCYHHLWPLYVRYKFAELWSSNPSFGWDVGRDTLPTGERRPLPREQIGIFHLKWHVLVNYERYFLSMPSPEKCWIFCLRWWFGGSCTFTVSPITTTDIQFQFWRRNWPIM